MDIVTLSTKTNDCDLRHQCVSKFNLHLCTWAQCCSGNGHNFFGTYSTLLYGQFHSYIFCDLFQPLLLVWPIPQMQVGLKPNFVTYSSTPSRPYSVPPLQGHLVTQWMGGNGDWSGNAEMGIADDIVQPRHGTITQSKNRRNVSGTVRNQYRFSKRWYPCTAAHVWISSHFSSIVSKLLNSNVIHFGVNVCQHSSKKYDVILSRIPNTFWSCSASNLPSVIVPYFDQKTR